MHVSSPLRRLLVAASILSLTGGAAGQALSGGVSHFLELTTGGSALRLVNVDSGGFPIFAMVPPTSPALAVPATPHVYAGFPALSAVDGGLSHALGVTQGSTAVGWGSNLVGELAAPPSAAVLPPVPINIGPVFDVAAGWSHSLAVTSGGSVLQWGLVPGTATVNAVPTPVPIPAVILDAAAFFDWSLAVDGPGSVYTWGRDIRGGFAAFNTFLPAPIQVPGLVNIELIDTGYAHGIALTDTGTLVAWGDGSFGQLGGTPAPVFGNTSLSIHNPPVPLQAISAGGLHSVALALDGTVWTWGNSLWGQLGLGDRVNRGALTQVPGLSQIVAVAANLVTTAALRQDGTLFVWGWLGPTGGGGSFNGIPFGSLVPMPVRSAGPFPAVIHPGLSAGCTVGPVLLTDQVPFLGNSGFRVSVLNQLQGPSIPTLWLYGAAGPSTLRSASFLAPGNCLYLDLASATSLVAAGLFPLTPAGLEIANPGTSRPYFSVPIPADPALAGQVLSFQAVAPTANADVPILSTPVQITLN